jgi:hypothetical protein
MRRFHGFPPLSVGQPVREALLKATRDYEIGQSGYVDRKQLDQSSHGGPVAVMMIVPELRNIADDGPAFYLQGTEYIERWNDCV